MDQQNTDVPSLDIRRVMEIWQWLLHPQQTPEPANLRTEEIMAAYCRNVMLLNRFRESLEKMSELHSAAGTRRIQNS